MEADWEVEIGGDAPVIDATWPGFVDLRQESGRVVTLREVSALPSLANALARLNAAGSPVWTSKCDVWEEDTFDPDEMDAPASNRASALACYIDLLPVSDDEWRIPDQVIDACKATCARLHQVGLRRCRVDLIVRRAFTAKDCPYAITAYLTACGATLEEARTNLGAALRAFVDSILCGDDAVTDA